MITVSQFSPLTLSTHKVFFVLDKLPKFAEEVDVWIQTPAGNESVDFISVFALEDGTLIAAWGHPFQKIPLHNLTAFCDGKTQIINLYPLERIIDIYDRPVDSESGTFHFTKSVPIDGGDWRCDRGMYGGGPFEGENVQRVIGEISEIIMYEPFLGVNSIAHVMYLQANGKSELASEKLNNSIVPITGRTLQETMRLIYEWSILAEEPFNSLEDVSVSSKAFLSSLRFTEEELETLSMFPPMQISNYLAGSEMARVRPSNIPALDNAIKTMVFKRMASSSLAALLHIHEIEDVYGLIDFEIVELKNGINRFREYYQIPEEWEMSQEEQIIEHCELYTKQGSYVHNQLRLFKNKQQIIDKVLNNEL